MSKAKNAFYWVTLAIERRDLKIEFLTFMEKSSEILGHLLSILLKFTYHAKPAK